MANKTNAAVRVIEVRPTQRADAACHPLHFDTGVPQ
jgi:hypothetical protein